MIELILKSLYFFLPAYFANMAPVFVKKIPFLDRPIWTKKLGTHKTWRGVVSAVVFGGFVFWLQKVAYVAGFRSLAVIDYSDFSIVLGLLLGFGAIFGDAVKSYYKRIAEIKEGNPWPVFDQIDFVVGGLVFSWFVYVPQAEVALIVLVLSPLLHFLINYCGYLLGIRKVKY
ncbi:CDP-archaeol synthase [Candidatus Woesearchaeota archaeon]|mgnify:FL=1|jgi:CDP-2,3-bis-(O-geranylgeranyl)-sn-glycerol synthase|nr:CDP-archaeol synthase [Candidatus Woesearchaeota archaeon]MBT4150465.1 CDP-archaeol synthase [Candidatus Woesearchaeota archaeon]MBT4247732.1 CDP-archaeol synthase [Candidatus Woesearchaeota archaeon]MBT4434669.1 CDP-archaeol synthase [Candidatus Woesearchaeota archaeon]MBT7332440.1 CDP-archaeol synthase [Candidatus Woesearchaeota archaeon]